jgi:tetratricopeptide (TPR) repeat protein
LYIPSIGFVLLASLVLAEAADQWRASHQVLPLVALAALALGYALGTLTQQTYWASDLLLYGRAYKMAPHDNLICNDLGAALMEAGDTRDAIALYSQVLHREPGFWLSNYNLGYTYYKLGRFCEAELLLRRAIDINAADSDEHIYLGLSVWRQGRADEAVSHVERAIQIRPSAPGYHFILAMIRREQNDVPAARSEFNLELQYHPDSTAARQQLAALNSGAVAGSK